MNESEFNRLAEEALARIEKTIDEHGGDVECNRSGNVLEVEFDNGQKIIINRHDVNKEIWIAAKSGGFHYAWLDNAWRDRREGGELYAKLSTLFADQGEEAVFTPHG